MLFALEAYDTVYFLMTKMTPGSAAAFEANSTKFIFMKEDEYSVKLVYCLEGEVREERFRFREDEANRVANEILMRLNEISNREVKELKLLKQVDFSECVPKREEKRTRRELRTDEILAKLSEVPKPYSFIPLLSYKGQILGFVPEGPAILPGEWRSPSLIGDGVKGLSISPDQFARAFAYFKLDPKKGLSVLRYDSLVFFSAFHVDLGETGSKVKWENREIPERKGKFIVCNSAGRCHFEELNYLTFDQLVPGTLNFGWFVKDANAMIRLGGIALKDSQEAADLMVRSLYTLSNGGELDIKAFSSVADFFINNLVSKHMPSKELREFIVVTSNPTYLDVVTSVSPSSIRIEDPNVPWGGSGVRATLFNEVLKTLKSIGYFKSLFL